MTELKQAILVLAPEGHGGHLITDLLVHAGCHGSSGNHVPWVPDVCELGPADDKPWEHALPTDIQPWDKAPPTVETPIVWRRSVPHGGDWVDIATMVTDLQDRAYAVHIVIAMRDWHAAAYSQLKWRHVDSLDTAMRNIARAYKHIFAHVIACNVPYIVASYESIVGRPEAQDALISALGLIPPTERLPVWDGNAKWFAKRRHAR
jgi:hypothetical protein